MKNLLLVCILILISFHFTTAIAQPQRTPPPIEPLKHTVPTQERAHSLPYFDDMESGTNGWISLGLFRQIENPDTHRVMRPLVNPLITVYPDGGYLPAPPNDGNTVWGYSDRFTNTYMGFPFPLQFPLSGGTSLIPKRGTLMSPLIDLTNVQNAKLTFWTWWEIEAVDSNIYDLMDVEIDYNDGGFRRLELLNPLYDIDLQRERAWMAYSSGGLGKRGMWVKKCYDLTPHVGNEVRVRFVFTSRDNLYNGFRGWFIDDVAVEEGTFSDPIITGFDKSAAIPNGILHIYGENFLKGSTVKFSSRFGTSTAISRTWSCGHIKAKVPTMTQGTKDIIVENPDGSSYTLEDEFEVLSIQELPPKLLLIHPIEGENDASTELTIIGSGFEAGTTVFIDDVELTNINIENALQMTATVPAGLTEGFKSLKVINPDSQYDELPLAFHVAAPGEALISTVIINEIMKDPEAVDDDAGEWFEIFNNTRQDIDLNGWTIADSSGEFHTINGTLILPSEDYAVLGINDNLNTNGGIPVDYAYSNFTLANDGDEILLYAPGNDLIDKVVYDDGQEYPNAPGRSMELRMTRIDNNIGFNWTHCVEQSDENSDFCTPGEENGGSSQRALIFPYPLRLDFGDSTDIGEIDTLQLYLGNLGQNLMYITDITSDNPIFQVEIPFEETLPDTVKGGGALIINITYIPAQEDTLYTGQITITSTAHNGYSLKIPVSGGNGVFADPDVNNDGLVDILDAEELISKIGAPYLTHMKYDLKRDGEINIEDLKELVNVLIQRLENQ